MEQSLDDFETEKARTDYEEGMSLGDRVRAADGMRSLKRIDGSNLTVMAQMFGKDPALSSFDLYYLDFSRYLELGVGLPSSNLNTALMAALAVGDGKAVSNALVEMGKLEGGDLEILAQLIEANEQCAYVLFVQRRTGPRVDPLARKAKEFMINQAFKKISKTKMMKKVAHGLVQDHFKKKKGFGKSSISKALAYFDQFKKWG